MWREFFEGRMSGRGTTDRPHGPEMDAKERQRIDEWLRHLVDETAPEERITLLAWLVELLTIRASDATAGLKFARAIRATTRRRTVVTILRTVGRPLVRLAWTDRSWKARLAGIGITLSALVWPGQSAGLALLGTAVAVPLWIVFGSGALVAGWTIDVLLDSVSGLEPGTGRARPRTAA